MAYAQSIVILAPVSDSPFPFTRAILVDDSPVLSCLLLQLPQRLSHPWPNLRSRNTSPTKSTNANFVLGHSVEANIEADMKDRVSFSVPFPLVNGGVAHGGVIQAHLWLASANPILVAQTPKSDRSNAQSAAAPLSDETFCSDTTELSTPKMEVYRWSAKSRDGRVQSQRPKRLPQSRPSTWIRRRWNK